MSENFAFSQPACSDAVWDKDRQCGRAGVDMSYALDSQYPNAGRSWPWFWVFPSPTLSSTTMIYTHVLDIATGTTVSPLDRMVAVGPDQKRLDIGDATSTAARRRYKETMS